MYPPMSLPGKGLATDILGNPSKGSGLLSRKESSHGASETKEKVLLQNRNGAQLRNRSAQAWPRQPGELPPLSLPAPSEPAWTDGRTPHRSAEWWGRAFFPVSTWWP